MSGLCGSLDASPKERGQNQAIAAGMLNRLPQDSRNATAVFRDGTVSYSGRHGDIHEDGESGIVAVVAGKPIWSRCGAELAAIAEQNGHAAALAAAYRRLGDQFLNAVEGVYAIALLDCANQCSYIAVDRLGVYAMCYARTSSGSLVFGSTTNSVLAHPDVQSSLSNDSIYRYFYFHVVPSPATIYQDVFKLEPAQLVRNDHSALTRSFFWSPDPSTSTGTESDDELIEQLRDQTRAAVERSQPDDKTGCFLSGGLDSSTVCGLANETTNQPIRAYTIGFDQHGFDETGFARTAARHFGLEHVEYYVTPPDVAEAFDLLSTAYDEPFGNSSAIPAYFCAKRAREDGVERLLAGDGGDELFAGNERYATQILFQKYSRVPAALRGSLIEPLFSLLRFDRPVLLRKAWRYIEQAKVQMPDRLQTYNFLEMFAPESVFGGEFLGSIDTGLPQEEMREWYRRGDDYGFLTRMLLFDWKLTLADNDIRKVNRMCETAGVDVDYPLLDQRLVDFSFKLPDSLKLKRSDLRFAFKEAFREFLPREILEKEKHGFGLPFGEWLKSSPELRDEVMPRIDQFRRRDILRDGFIDDMLDKHRNEHATYFGNMLWLIAVLENWLASNQH